MSPGFWTRSWLGKALSADPVPGRRRRYRLGGRSLVRWVEEGPLVSSMENMQISLMVDRQCRSRRGSNEYTGTRLSRGAPWNTCSTQNKIVDQYILKPVVRNMTYMGFCITVALKVFAVAISPQQWVLCYRLIE